MTQDTTTQPAPETRRSRRRKVQGTIHVVDVMTEQVIGHLGNVSDSGLLLIAHVSLVEDALYQVRFTLGDGDGDGAPLKLELGVHLLWHQPAGTPGVSWNGFRYITIADHQLDQLRHWVDADPEQQD